MVKSRVPTEHQEQAALMEWATLLSGRAPELALLFAIPNGGHRHPAVAGQLRAEGVKAGVPDLFLPVPRHPYFGLFIEMKRQRHSTMRQAQKWWSEQLAEQGYRVVECRGADAAMKVIQEYLGWTR